MSYKIQYLPIGIKVGHSGSHDFYYHGRCFIIFYLGNTVNWNSASKFTKKPSLCWEADDVISVGGKEAAHG